MTTKTKNKNANRQLELMRGFHFNRAALEANRQGIVAEQQLKWIPKREGLLRIGILYWLTLGVSLGIIVSGCFWFIAGNFSNNGFDITFTLFLFGFPFIVLAILTVLYGLPRQRILRELKRGEVKSIQGLAVVDLGNERVESSLTINNMRLKAPKSALLRIKHLEPHVVYYLPRSKVIVSVEVMEA